MNEGLKQRIQRRIEGLSDERGYQILDYVEFLESKYAERSSGSGIFAKLTETAEDTMRAAGVPIRVISGTMGLAESAGKVMKGVAAAASAAVDEAVGLTKGGSGKPGAGSREREAGSAAQGVGSAEQGVESGKRGAGSGDGPTG
jgi:hypothetical protein